MNFDCIKEFVSNLIKYQNKNNSNDTSPYDKSLSILQKLNPSFNIP